MAITIRNKTTEELIRKIGRRTGEGPSAVISRLVAREAAGENDTVPPEEVKRRMARFEELAELYPPRGPAPTWPEVEREIEGLYDYLGTEPAAKTRQKQA